MKVTFGSWMPTVQCLLRRSAPLLWAGIVLPLFSEQPDKFVRFVESTGEQAVDVGITGRYGMRAEISMQWMALGGDDAFLDARGNTSTDSRIFFCHNSANGVIGLGYGSYTKYSAKIDSSWVNIRWELGRRYMVVTEFAVTDEDKVKCTLKVDGSTIADGTSDAKIDTERNLYLFAGNIGGTVQYPSKARCYGLKLWQDGELVRDLYPCVKDGRAGLYDAVSETILYSFTGTDLIACDDTPDYWLDYVEAVGDTYIDTGVIGRSGTRAEADLVWTQVGGDYSLLAARGNASTDSRILMIHTYNNGMSLGYGNFQGNASHKYTAGTRYLVQSDLRAGSQTVTVNGETVYSGTSSASIDTGRNLYLFANNVAGSVKNQSFVQLYSLKIWQQDGTGAEQLVRDLRPCMKNGEIALYDAVEERILYPETKTLETIRPTIPGKPDYFVEYIQANADNQIDTGIRARSGTRAQGEFLWTTLRSSAEEYDIYRETDGYRERTFLGAVGSNADATRFYMIHENNKSLWSGYGSQRIYPTTNLVTMVEVETTNEDGSVTTDLVEQVTPKNITMATNTRYSFDISYDAGLQTIDFNGVRVLEKNNSASIDAGCNLGLFARNTTRGHAYYPVYGRCYTLKLWQDGALVRDFKPCVKDGLVMLYDAVSDVIFQPTRDIPATSASVGRVLPLSGTERPVSFVEYVETDGTQHIDTGVIGRSGTVAEFEMQWLPASVNSDDEFLGVRPNTSVDNRYYMWHIAKNSVSFGYGAFKYLKNGDPTATLNGGENPKIPAQIEHTYHVYCSLSADEQVMKVDGETILNRTDPLNLDTGMNLYLFAANVGGQATYACKTRLYWLKIWQDGKLVRNYRPVRLDNNLVTLWDMKSNEGVPPTAGLFNASGPDTGKFILYRGTLLIMR